MKNKMKLKTNSGLFLGMLLIFFLNINLFSQPQIKIENTILNFGDVSFKETPIRETVVVKNVGTDTLQILNVRPDCGCTVAPIEKNILPPGDSTKIQIEFDIRNFTGLVTKNINIFSNDPQRPNISINMRCNVIRPFVVVPQYLSFDRVFVGEPSTTEMQIVNNSSEDAIVRSVRVDNPEVIVNIQAENIIKKDEPFVLKATAIATRTGSIRTNIIIEIQHPEENRIEILGFGNAINPTKK